MRCLDAYALDQFHSELINDITPAVEGKYSTFATDTREEALIASRDHRGFGGFSMGAVNTWCTFRYAMDYFRYFMPMSGSYGVDGRNIAAMVTDQGYTADDFFIFSMSGPDDFAYSGIKAQIESMVANEMFTYGNTEEEGNLAWREMAGFQHGPEASDLYTYNGLQFFWNGEAEDTGETDGTKSMKYKKDSLITNVMADSSFGEYGISVSGTNVFPGRFFLWMKSIQDVIITIICTLYKLGCMHRVIDIFPQTKAIFRYLSANGD